MTLEDIFVEFLENLKGQSVCNRRNYRQRLAGFIASYGHCQLEEISPGQINHWLSSLPADYAPATLAGYRQAIKAMFNWLVRVGYISSSPAAHIVVGKFLASRPRLPAEDQVIHLASQAAAWLDSPDAIHVRDGLIFLLSFGSGPRISEIRNLRYSAIQSSLLRGPDIYQVYHVETTGKTGPVLIRFNQRAAAGFQHWLTLRPTANNDYCFTSLRQPYNQLTRSGITKCYQRLALAAGLERSILSQALRHRAGNNTTRHYGAKTAAVLLNHADWQSASTAVAFYHHPDENDVSAAVVRLARMPDDYQELARLFGVR